MKEKIHAFGDKPYYSLNHYYRSLYGDKVYKIALNGGFTCPNRDGTLDTRGCIFCSTSGSGDFTLSQHISIADQIESGINALKNKYSGNKYIAYFQSFTNTYGTLDYLKSVYYEAINHESIVGISIATRPDCITKDIIDLLVEVNSKKKVWIELGLQSIHENTAKFIRRGYSLTCFDKAITQLQAANIDIIVHLILGLPHESKEDIFKSVDYVCRKKVHGIKLQLLHILKDTDLANVYLNGHCHVYSLSDYANLVVDCIERIPPNVVIHRITGDGPKSLLLAPDWSRNKRHVLNTIHQTFNKRLTYQGRLFDSIVL